MVDRQRILDLVRSRKYRSMTTEELARRLRLADEEVPELLAMLEKLQLEGHVVCVKKTHWVNPQKAGMVVGRLQCNPRGFGFVIPVPEDTADVYVNEEDMGEALHNDLVVVELHKHRPRGRRGAGPAGRIVKVLVHENERVIGTFMPGRRFGWVAADDPRLFRDIYVARGDEGGAGKGDKVLAKITAWPSLHRNPEGEIVRVLGKEGAPGVDVLSVIFQFGLPHEFSSAALKAAQRLKGKPSEEQKRRRRDYTARPTVTIDPEDAKDYDDALSLYRDPKTGHRIVLVHIADVSHYVPPGSALDVAARERGCSVYLANDVVPMLPQQQSREVLSLVEGEERPAKTVALEYDDSARLVGYSVCHSVVRVDRRMTYKEVKQVLDAADHPDDALAAPVLQKLPEDVVDLLLDLDELARQLRSRRQDTGSVDLDLPEYDVRVNETGEVISVSQIVRDRSHSLVEELMLAANCAVADFMKQNRLPALYRVHDEPEEEDLAEFVEFVQTVIQRKINPLDRKQLQHLLADVAATPLREAVNMQLLRSMKRAEYSTVSRPHFALHFDNYCHFTSPVRRYPDLLIHQVLDEFMLGKQKPPSLRARWQNDLPAIATHCNETQQRADEAEREIVKIKLLRFLEGHKDEVFDAVITGVEEFGLFVQLQRYSVEGLIRVKDLKDDFYRLDTKRRALVGSRKGKIYRLGQALQVVLDKIDMARREADFRIHT